MQISEYQIITLLFMSLIHIIPLAGKKDYFTFSWLSMHVFYAYVLEALCGKLHTSNKYLCLLSSFSHVWLCDPMDSSPPGSSVHGVLQAGMLE